MKLMPQDVEVRFTLLKTEDGGRAHPMIRFASYRPQFHYDGSDWDCVVEIAVESVALGQSAIAVISFFSPDQHFGKLTIGSPFVLREGARIVAYGAISRLLNLEQAALRAQSTRSG